MIISKKSNIKSIVNLLIIFLFSNAMAQDQDIVGVYNLGSNSPEGGSSLIVLENGKFAIMYFGGMQIGDWKSDKENIFLFTPYSRENEFELYGRHDKNLDGKLRICFQGFEQGETFISLDKPKKDDVVSVKRVFNIDANCFSYPDVKTFANTVTKISFASVHESEGNIMSHFDIKEYNDFVAYFFKKDNEARPFRTIFKDNKLYFDEKNSAIKRPLPQEGEDIQFIRDMVEKEVVKDKVFYNPSYNKFEGNIDEYYVFSNEKEAYIDPQYYKEGSEFIKDDEAFHDMSIIYGYEACKMNSSTSNKLKIEEKPIFQVDCD